MRANRWRDTQPELLVREALRAYGLRYRTHERSVPGRPDLVFRTARLAVFCDGDFWHGRYWARLRVQLERRANSDYWIAKIAANRARDVLQRQVLRKAGWTVLRVWESTIRNSPETVARHIASALESAHRTRSIRSNVLPVGPKGKVKPRWRARRKPAGTRARMGGRRANA